MAVTVVAFANADGGTVAIGISDKTRRIEGTDYEIRQLNELLTVPYDFCEPTVQVAIEKVACTDDKGRDNHVVLMHIEPSSHVHSNQADEVYLRVGDKSKKLGFNDRLQLTYDKGERFFEDKGAERRHAGRRQDALQRQGGRGDLRLPGRLSGPHLRPLPPAQLL